MMPPPTDSSPLFQFMQSISLSNDVCIDIVDDNAKVHSSLCDPLQGSSSSASATRWDPASPAQGDQRKGHRHDSFPPLQNSLHAPERLPSLDCIDRFLDECPKREASPTSILPHRLPSIDAMEEASRIMDFRRGLKKTTTKWLLDDEDIMSSIVKMPQRLPSLSNIVCKKMCESSKIV